MTRAVVATVPAINPEIEGTGGPYQPAMGPRRLAIVRESIDAPRMTDSPSADRSRVIQWQDPASLAAIATELGGVAALHAMIAQNLQAPVSHLLDFELVHAEVGKVRFACRTHESQYNPMGTVHGGVISTWLDSALGAAVYSALGKGSSYTTAQLNVHFVRPLLIGVEGLFAEGEVVRMGRQLATSQGRVVDGQGRLYAHGSATCLIFS